MDTLDLRDLTASDNWEDANCLTDWANPSWWVAPDIKGKFGKERLAEAREDAQALCGDCPAAVICLLGAAIKKDTGTVVAGMFGNDLKSAYKALAAGADPATLIGGDSK